MKQFLESLKNRNACIDAIKFVKHYETPQEAWDACENSDWMSWLLRKSLGKPTPEQHKSLVRIACECARLVLPMIGAAELQPLRAIEAAEAWLCRKATKKVVIAAADAAAYESDVAFTAADVAGATYTAAYYAADAAAQAAYACGHAADAAARAAYAIDAACAADASYTAAYESEVAVQKQIANIIRRYFPELIS